MLKEGVLFVELLDSSTNPELFESYDVVVGLLYPGGDKSRDILLDRCRLCRSGLESS